MSVIQRKDISELGYFNEIHVTSCTHFSVFQGNVKHGYFNEMCVISCIQMSVFRNKAEHGYFNEICVISSFCLI